MKSLTGGDYSTLTGGDGSIVTGGINSTLTGGHYSILTGGNYSTLIGGNNSNLTGGYRSRFKASKSVFVCRYHFGGDWRMYVAQDLDPNYYWTFNEESDKWVHAEDQSIPEVTQ